MNRCRHWVSAAEFLARLNEGGWSVLCREPNNVNSLSGFNAYCFPANDRTMMKITADNLHIVCSGEYIFQTDPWNFNVHDVLMKNEQRKKVEGGGWHEVPRPGKVVFSFYNTALREKISKEQQEQFRLREALRHDKEKERQRILTEKYEAAKREFCVRLQQTFVGDKINGIDIEDGSLIIYAEGGHKLCADIYREDDRSCIAVNGVSLADFTKVS